MGDRHCSQLASPWPFSPTSYRVAPLGLLLVVPFTSFTSALQRMSLRCRIATCARSHASRSVGGKNVTVLAGIGAGQSYIVSTASLLPYGQHDRIGHRDRPSALPCIVPRLCSIS